MTKPQPPARRADSDTERWLSARSLADLGDLTAQFLEGEISQSPSHSGPPDPRPRR
jgi:hypothetical protein